MTTDKKLTLVSPANKGVTDAEAESAVRLLIEWIGEDPSREGLIETPRRYIDAWKEFFKGYKEDPRKHLKKTIGDVGTYDTPITLQNIRVETTCEHHLVPFIGEAFISYIPDKKVVGISKLIRLMDGYAKRMQIQERLTYDVAQAIHEELAPKGVAVAIRSEHFCMTTRGAHRPGARMMTTAWFGDYKTNESLRKEFLSVVNASRTA